VSGYPSIEADHPGLEAVRPVFSAEWWRTYMAMHLAKYPNLDVVSRRNLDEFVARAEAAE
jgi:hypothetical protein